MSVVLNSIGQPLGYLTIVEETATNLADEDAAINVTDKYAGKLVWDTTNTRLMRASGSGVNDTWVVVDGSTSVTPS